ncbi:hypothetical protein DESUT3_29870 [Desulfuromonas versatilis]|uniref:Small ribosomal subunit protein bS6 n=1 Tax=Desulfuromonas versatilis TaxID=2802975 RepID=A0ABM8HV94_9BACT|nr:30S ribosomal protein S6 [Desulfuromonas versatilis]BCR05918.1 hypothetical protein DESUT3_29870 [Desulfuromonas versatilis]
MRTYETIFIVHPEVVGDEYAGVVEKFKGVLTEQQANILKIDEWGARKLAYPVKKQGRGSFVLVVYEATSEVIAEFERRMRIDDKVIKFQTVLREEGAALEEASAAGSEGAEVEEEETEEAEETE